MKSKNITVNGVEIAVFEDGSIEKPNRNFKDNRLERTFGWNAHGYRKIKIGNKRLQVHRLVAEAFLNDYSEGLQVDHANGQRADNRPENLRMVTNQQNGQAFKRKMKGASSKFRGVYWNKHLHKWKAQIKVDGRNEYLGLFTDELNAAEAYNRAALKLGFAPEALNPI